MKAALLLHEISSLSVLFFLMKFYLELYKMNARVCFIRYKNFMTIRKLLVFRNSNSTTTKK